MTPTRSKNCGSDVKSWLQFTVRLAALVLGLAGGFATLYARLCVVETKVESVMERIVQLEAKVDAQNKKAGRDDNVVLAR
jgi:hypothetical protein